MMFMVMYDLGLMVVYMMNNMGRFNNMMGLMFNMMNGMMLG